MRKEEKWGVSLLHILRLDKLLLREKSTRQFVETIEVRGDKDELLHRIWGKRLLICCFILILGVLTFFYCQTEKTQSSLLSGDNYVTRQAEDETIQVQVEGSSSEGTWNRDIPLLVKSRVFSEEEKKKLTDQVFIYINARYLGKNPSSDAVTKRLCLVSEIPDAEISLKWYRDEEYINENGTLRTKKVPMQGVDTDLLLKASWKNWKKSFRFPVHLMRKNLTAQEKEIQKVKETLAGALKAQKTQEKAQLPDQVDDIALTYQTEEESKNFIPFFLVLGVLLLLPIIWREEQKKKMEQREEQMRLDYPGFVNQFMLLLGAGMTVRKAVERLVYEYEQEREHSKGRETEIRYVKEEICVLFQEMKDGISEGTAMEHFGKRCRLLPYMRFTSIITQNLRKGAEGMLDILEHESIEALEQRKERVLQIGERAGTKLLFPMMLMLGLVMGIIMVPAFMTM